MDKKGLHFKTTEVNLHKKLTFQQHIDNQFVEKFKGLSMKNLLSVAAVIATGLFTSQASAADMECYVDTQAYDHFTSGHCFALIYGASSATAVFRIAGANKPISSVIWGDKASSCGTSGTSCSFTIRPFRANKASATILYQDGTWETASATASFEDGR
jgi:hypothetical protein